MSNRACSTKLRLQFQPTITNTMVDGQQANCQLGGQLLNETLDSGASTDEANRAWEDLDRELASSATFTLDVHDMAGVDIGAGDGNDALGQAMDLEEIVTFIVQMDDASDVTGRLEITPAPLNGWEPVGENTVARGNALRAGGMLLRHQPHESAYDVADGASNRVLFTAVGGLCRFSIYIVGRNDDEVSSSSSSSSSSTSSGSSSSTSSNSSSSSSSSSTSSLSSSSSTSSANSSSSSTSSVNSSSSSSTLSSNSSSSTSSVNSSSSSTSSVNSSSSSSTSSRNSSSSSTSSLNSSSSTSSVNSSSSSSSTSSASSSSSS
jgi:hypothetical protein